MRFLLLTVAALATGQALQAQAPAPAPTPVLTIDEAVALAHRNNPDYLQTANDPNVAGAQLRSAYGAFLPSVDASFGTSFREGRQQFFGGEAIGATSDVVASSYDISAFARYNLGTFMAPKLQRASVRATEADVGNAAAQLKATVRQQYLTVLQQQARAGLQDSLLSQTKVQLELARARASVGSATILDVQRAEVAVGQQEVALLQARNQAEVEKLRLFQQIGVPQPANVQLTSTFEATQPNLSLEQILDLARRANPSLNAVRAREDVANLNYRTAQAQYTPTLSLQAGVGGYTNKYENSYVLGQALQRQRSGCLQPLELRQLVGMPVDPSAIAACNAIQLTPEQIAAARSSNEAFPFDFERSPYQLSASISIPIFNGLTREQRVQEAAAGRADARYGVRAQELALTANVTAAYLNLETAARTVSIQEQNARTARSALTLAEERYRAGANTLVDVNQARADYERAETERINAVYEYHRLFAALESAVGRPLR